MKLVIAIVQSADSGRLTDALVAKGFRSTRINTVGGFLDEPNVTMLIGIDKEPLDELLEVIKQNCQTRRRFMNAAPMAVETVGMPVVTAAPIEVEVGGATVFVLPVRDIIRLGKMGDVPQTGMKGKKGVLMLAVVQAEDAASATAALIEGGFRLTRINSVGSFLKKGNATLLIGTVAEYVDKALNLLHTSTRQRSEPTPVKAGLPSYGATVFLLDMVPLSSLPGVARA